jgi:hypothetical protein
MKISSSCVQFSSSNLLLLKFSGITKLTHFLDNILEILDNVFLLYGENKSKNSINLLNGMFGILSFFVNQIRQLLTLGAGEKAFAGTVFK